MGRMLKRGQATGRADDNPETIQNRLKVYHESTTPLRDFYIKEGKYRPIPGSGSTTIFLPAYARQSIPQRIRHKHARPRLLQCRVTG